VVGPVCESSDDFGEHAIGDEVPKLVARSATPALTAFVMASEYNGRPLPARSLRAGRQGRHRESRARASTPGSGVAWPSDAAPSHWQTPPQAPSKPCAASPTRQRASLTKAGPLPDWPRHRRRCRHRRSPRSRRDTRTGLSQGEPSFALRWTRALATRLWPRRLRQGIAARVLTGTPPSPQVPMIDAHADLANGGGRRPGIPRSPRRNPRR
jgi:hypothetical protein